MDDVEYVWVRKPNGTVFRLRTFGHGDTRNSSHGVIERVTTGRWRFQSGHGDGYEIIEQ